MDIDSCIFTAGFAGDHALRAVFLMIGGRPMISASWSIWTRRFALVYGARSYFSAMLSSTVDTFCVRLRIFSYLLGLTVDTYVAVVVVLAVAWFLPVCWLR